MSKLFQKSFKIIKRIGFYHVWIINDFANDYGGLVAPKYKLGVFGDENSARKAAKQAVKR